MYVRHFDTALVSLEKDRAIRLRLSRADGDTFVFESVRPGENPRVSVMTRTDQGFTASSELGGASGRSNTIRVEYGGWTEAESWPPCKPSRRPPYVQRHRRGRWIQAGGGER